MLDITRFQNSLHTKVIGQQSNCENEIWDSIDSTNERALTLARQGAPAGVVIAARQQLAGRGRQGRSWHSPLDAGLYVSILLHPQLPANKLPLLSFASGVAAAEAILQITNLEIQLKWVNDLILEGKKLGGILAESVGRPDQKPQQAVIIGIGINLINPGGLLPEELIGKIAYINDTSTAPIDATALLIAYCQAFEYWYKKVEEGQEELMLNTWRQLSVTLGKQVTVHEANSTRTFSGLALDIDESGALLIQAPDNTINKIYSGDVSVRLLDGSYC